MKKFHKETSTEKNKNLNAKKNKFFSTIFSDYPFIIVFCIPVIIYLHTLRFELSWFDDNLIIQDNISFLKNFRNIGQAFLRDAFIGNSDSFYRPLQTVSYMIDLKLSGGNNVLMHHLTNILLFGIIATLLLVFLRKFNIPPKLALLSTLIFCVNPLFVSSVAWIPARGDLLLSLFSLLSFIFLIDFVQKQKIMSFIWHWVAFTLALFCKETAAFLPFLFILYYLFYSSKNRPETKHLLYVAFYAISGLCWFWLRYTSIGAFANAKAMIGFKAILLNLRTIPESLSKFFLPFDFAPIPSFSIFNTIAGICIIILLFIIVLRNKGSLSNDIVFCLSWFFILMLPPMLIKHPLIDYLDHRFLLPFIGFLLFVLIIILKNWLKNEDIERPWLMIGVIVVFCICTFVKSRAYEDPMTFYNKAITQNPKSAFAYFNRGGLKINRKDFRGGIEDNTKALAIFPLYDMAFVNRGIAKGFLGDLNGAIADMDSAIFINKSYIDAYYNRGFAKHMLGQNEDAILDYDKSLSIDSNYTVSYIGRGKALAYLGKFQAALIDFNKAIELNNSNLDAYYFRALTLYSLKDYNAAIKDCDRILKLSPNHENALRVKDKCNEKLQK